MKESQIKRDADAAPQDGRYYGAAAEFAYAIREARKANERVSIR